MHIRRLSHLGLSCVALLALFGLRSATGQGGEADIAGVVTDLSGAAVPTAQITLTNTDTGVERTIGAQNSGEYRFASVAPGHYSLMIKAPSFTAETIAGFTINLGLHLQENAQLKPGSDQQSVIVSGEVPLIDPSDNTVGGVISNQQIQTLPISQRQYLNLALLLPGTTQDATRTFYNNVQSGGGGYFYANGFMLDGVTNTWAEQGEPRQNIPEGAVQEFKVYVSQFPAEFGLAMGGMTTVVTKSGTNQIHGEVFEYFRNEALSADNRFQQQAEKAQGTGRPPFLRNQFGGDVGGPIIRNRTHYYGAYERTQTDSSYTIFTAAPQFYGANQGTFDEPSHDQMLTLRGDHQISNNQQLFVRYAQEWNELTRQGCGGANTQYCYDGQIPRHSIVVGHTWEPRPAIVNDAHFQYAYSSYQLGPYGEKIPTSPNQLKSPTFNEISTGYSFPSFSYGKIYSQVGIEKHWELNDAVSIQHKQHTFKFGGDIIYVPYVDSSAANSQGTFFFSTDQKFDPKDPSTIANLTNPYLFTASIPAVVTNLPSTQMGLFGQDDWKVTPTLNLSLGLRYDREYGSSFNDTLNPANYTPRIPFQGDPSKRGAKLNFGPRLGLTWDPFHRGIDVIRAGYGVYYNNIQTELNEFEKQNFAVCNITITNPSYPDPYNGRSATDFCSTAPPNVTVLSPSYRNPYSQQFSAGYSHQFGNTMSLSVDGVYQHLLRDFRIIDLNYPVNGVRPLADWGQILQHASVGRGQYKGLFVRLDKRFSRRYLYTVSYTLSSARDSNPQTNVTDYANYNRDFGPSNIDRRHALVVSGSVVLPGNITVGSIWTWRSSLPFTAYSGTSDADGISQYVPGTSRNQGNRDLNLTAVNTYRAGLGLVPIAAGSIQSSQYNNFDLRISRPIFTRGERSVELIGQAFNLFGHTNLLGANMTTNAQSSNFGRITAASNAQQGELAARFVF
jgi:outer membrane receptor protein involved in Fe transport